MKRLVLICGLALALFVNAFGGWTPNSGYAGCSPGIYWYNDETGEGYCCPPGIECPLFRSTYEPPIKKTETEIIFDIIFLNIIREKKFTPILR